MGEPSRNLSVNDVEVHTYSVGLLSQLQFMQQFADCYDNLKGHKVRSEQCQNTLNLGGLFSQIILSVYINLLTPEFKWVIYFPVWYISRFGIFLV
jgi:hypothetical protein